MTEGFSPGGRLMRTLNVALVGILVTTCLWGISRFGFFDNFERSTLDLRFRLSPTTSEADSSIILVLLDGRSMDLLPWPVPRQIYSEILSMIHGWGTRAVAFDILFDVPSVYSAVEDSIFGSVASVGSTVFVMALLQREGSEIPCNAIIDIPINSAELDSAWYCTPPTQMIARGADILGSTSDRQDPDGVFRSIRLLTATPEGIAPSLPVALAWLALECPDISVNDDRFTIGDITLRTSGNCRLQLKYHGPAGTYTSIPLADLTAALNARATGQPCPVDTTVFNGATVLFGYAAPALYDLKPTPYSPQCPGVEVLATAVDNIMNGNHIRRYPSWVSLLIALMVSLLSAYFLSAVSRIPLGALLAALPTLLFLAASLFLFRSGIWLETVWPATSGILTILAGGIFLFSSENRRKQEIRNAFSQYLSPDVVAQVTEHPETLVLGGDKRNMTVFFSDIWGFTGISEKLSPEELVALINRYLTTMTDIILETGGTVDKFEGDAIIAFWGAPIWLEDHASRACSAALRCQEAHAEMNRQLVQEGHSELFTRIGLSTGDMVVGNMGSSRRFDYTVMGSTVNLGARLEGANKVYDTSIMVQEDTFRNARDNFIFRELDTIRVIGQQEPVTVYELKCRQNEITDELESALKDYSKALALYRKGDFKDAERTFSSVGDPTSLIMAKRCRIMADEHTNDPGKWDGVFNLSSK
ncbi:MAG: adenylate/guanylate cyclase domain-containing protein [Candidatus Aegiribacteria sp.]|nr:adenylate/guanylate cyclase domain-containing protein [Candidatus Aegiribacteria sp.]